MVARFNPLSVSIRSPRRRTVPSAESKSVANLGAPRQHQKGPIASFPALGCQRITAILVGQDLSCRPRTFGKRQDKSCPTKEVTVQSLSGTRFGWLNLGDIEEHRHLIRDFKSEISDGELNFPLYPDIALITDPNLAARRGLRTVTKRDADSTSRRHPEAVIRCRTHRPSYRPGRFCRAGSSVRVRSRAHWARALPATLTHVSRSRWSALSSN